MSPLGKKLGEISILLQYTKSQEEPSPKCGAIELQYSVESGSTTTLLYIRMSDIRCTQQRRCYLTWNAVRCCRIALHIRT